MGFIYVPISKKPRKLSKKQKEKMVEDKARAKKKTKEKSNYWKTAPVHVSSKPYIPERNSNLKINNAPTVRPAKPNEYKIEEQSEEMLERERQARILAEERKKRTAPLYSKGPYQYIGEDPEIIKNLGKKL